MRKFFLGSTALVGLIAGPAIAADLAVKAPVYKGPSPPVVIYSWTGCYIGANIGGGWARKSWTTTTPPPPLDLGSHTASGVVGGGQIGCDYQTGPLVLGIEGMFDGANLRGSNIPPSFPNSEDVTRIPWFGTLTGRIGYAVDRALLYVKGGGAWVRDNHELIFVPTGVVGETGSVTRSGWTLGGGLEYALAPNWSARIEYDYLGFGTKPVTFCRPICDDIFDIKQNIQLLVVGINYRFSYSPVANY